MAGLRVNGGPKPPGKVTAPGLPPGAARKQGTIMRAPRLKPLPGGTRAYGKQEPPDMTSSFGDTGLPPGGF